MKKRPLYVLLASAALFMCFILSANASGSNKYDSLFPCNEYGDVNLDGSVTADDARTVLRAAVNLDKLDSDTFLRADIDADLKITADDARTILRMAVGLEKIGGHILEEVVVTQPTCTQEGLSQTKCVRCGEVFGQKTLEAAHKAGVWKTVKEATCIDKGLSQRACRVCGEVLEEKVTEETGVHQWGMWEYPQGQDCMEAKPATRTCTVCSKTENKWVNPTNSHSFRWIITKEYTCTASGIKEYTCTKCGYVEKTATIPPRETGHMASTWKTTVSPTCEKAGKQVRYCTYANCGEILYEREIPATGHTYDKNRYVIKLQPTCAKEGVAECNCLTCGKKVVDIVLPKKEHTYTQNWTTVRNATCTEDGLKTAVCRYCGNLEEVIKATGHKEVVTMLKAATCSEAGSEAVSCPVCRTTLEVREIPATGNHSFDTSTERIIKDPTCTEKGLKTMFCTTCKQNINIDIPATGKHTKNSEYTIIKEADCYNDAVEAITCKYCDYIYSQRVIKGTAHHIYSEIPTATKEAGCVEPGYNEYLCTRCKAYTRKDEIPARGSHDIAEWVTIKEPTCSEAGERKGLCNVCSETVTEEIAKIPHTFERIIEKTECKEGTVLSNGEAIQYICYDRCTVCGEKENEKAFDRIKTDSIYDITFTKDADFTSGKTVEFTVSGGNTQITGIVIKYENGQKIKTVNGGSSNTYSFIMPDDIADTDTVVITVYTDLG